MSAETNQANSFDPNHPYLKNHVVVLNGFSDQEIVTIMRAIKSLTKNGPAGEPPALNIPSADLIFAKSTPTSLNTVLGELIIDMSGDHEYLRKNPPTKSSAG